MDLASKRSDLQEVLAHKPFRYLWLGQIASQVASNMMLFLIGLLVYQKTASNTAVSGLFMAHGFACILFGLLAGTVVDYFDRRIILVVSSAVRCIIAFGLFLLLPYLPIVYILFFISAVVLQFSVPAYATYIPLIVPKTKLMVANSCFSFAYYASMAVGFVMAGPMLRLFGVYGSMTFLIALFLFAMWTATRLPNVSVDSALIEDKLRKYTLWQILEKGLHSTSEGFSYLTSSKSLSDAVLLLTGTQIIFAMLSTLGPGFADQVLGIDIRDASLVIVGPAIIGMIVGSMWLGNVGFRFKPQSLIQKGILIAGIMLVSVSLTVYLQRFTAFHWLFNDIVIIPVEIFLFFVLGFANSILDIPANSILQSHAEGDIRGRVYGILAAAVGGAGIIPVMIGGVLADFVGVGKVIFSLGILIMLYGLFRRRYSMIKEV